MPENVEKIKVSYSYFRPTSGFLSDLKPTNTVDIGLNDCNGKFLGWSGSAHSTVFVGEYSSSAGYLTLPIESGNWQIIIGAYRIMPNGVDVEYEIDFEFKKERLLYGDLHIHSTASDGALSAFDLAKAARKKKLDFIALANHNNFAENFHLPFVDDLTFIPAVEWTHYKGHMNFFGINAPFENSFIANTKEEMLQLVENARRLGATVSVNHPKCNFCPYLWEDENAFDMLEIWNGPMRSINVKAIAWWTNLLKKGRKIPIVGGSDYHKPHHFAKLGNPVTGVYTPSPSAEDIMRSIKSGRCFVADSAGSTYLRLKYNGTEMGGTAKFSENLFLEIESNAKSVKIVTDSAEFTEKTIGGKAKIKLGKTKFAYAVVYSDFGKKITAISNPIYFEEEKQ